jgi:hypothetical protein
MAKGIRKMLNASTKSVLLLKTTSRFDDRLNFKVLEGCIERQELREFNAKLLDGEA